MPTTKLSETAFCTLSGTQSCQADIEPWLELELVSTRDQLLHIIPDCTNSNKWHDTPASHGQQQSRYITAVPSWTENQQGVHNVSSADDLQLVERRRITLRHQTS